MRREADVDRKKLSNENQLPLHILLTKWKRNKFRTYTKEGSGGYRLLFKKLRRSPPGKYL